MVRLCSPSLCCSPVFVALLEAVEEGRVIGVEHVVLEEVLGAVIMARALIKGIIVGVVTPAGVLVGTGVEVKFLEVAIMSGAQVRSMAAAMTSVVSMSVTAEVVEVIHGEVAEVVTMEIVVDVVMDIVVVGEGVVTVRAVEAMTVMSETVVIHLYL